MLDTTHSVPDICEIHRHAPPADDGRAPSLLIELPHGATRQQHYRALQRRLNGTLPQNLEAFFFVNTDVGTPECAQAIGQMLAGFGYSTLIVRSLIPRTLIDCNRTVSRQPESCASGMTAAIPEYIRDADDRKLLIDLHRQYHGVVGSAYDEICSAPAAGLALQLHSYAPKSISIDNIDDDIVAALRAAYEPSQYATWADRPEVELITETVDGQCLAPTEAVDSTRRNFAAIGIDAAENQSYRLHPDTWGYGYAKQHAGRVLCIELNRALLATPFSPFAEMTIGTAEAARLASPIALACASFLGLARQHR